MNIDLLLAIFFIAVAVTEGMNQRVVMSGLAENVYHVFRTVATWSFPLAICLALRWHGWLAIVLWCTGLDGLYNRILQAVRVLWVQRQPCHFIEVLNACDINYKHPVWWAWKHYWPWLDWAFLGVGIIAICLQ